jgi:pSer/pThr/pTyr-binding forkhead associated (FHA) protein
MSADPNKKSARTFQCRDVLWETFEQMARELECSVDYLVNEAMKQYARQRSYGASRTPHPSSSGRSVDASQPGAMAAPAPPPSPMPSSPKLAGGLPPPGRLPPPPTPARQGSALPPQRSALPVPPPPGRATASAMPPLPRSAPPPPLPSTRSVPPPLPRGSSSPGRPSLAPSTNGLPGHGHLTLVYNGERHSVTKDRFVIGRGKQSSDLTLKDPNVSRQHAMIEFQNGVYFMVDMGSTNGVAINGQRIARKQIAEGDIFRICDHDLQFTYR